VVAVGVGSVGGCPWQFSALTLLAQDSVFVLEQEAHRLVHEGDWRRWGSRGGREILRYYYAGLFAC